MYIEEDQGISNLGKNAFQAQCRESVLTVFKYLKHEYGAQITNHLWNFSS